MKSDAIYLDHAAATPMSELVLAAMRPYFSDQFFNPSATYGAARSVHDSLESARTGVAFWLGAQKSEIIFTAGGSEANNLAIHGVMGKHDGCNVIVSAIEHESVLAPASRYDRRIVPVNGEGVILADKLPSMIDDKTVLVSVMYANNEVGTVEPLRAIATILERIRADRKTRDIHVPLLLHTDACQAANYLDLHVARLGVDLMTINGGKLYGPKQSGALYVRRGITLRPLIDGGGQERNVRSGTENVAGCVGLAAALDESQKMRDGEVKRLHELQVKFIELLETKVPGVELNGPKHCTRLPNNIHITIRGADNERLIMALDMERIMAAAGSACSASDEEPSHVLKAMGKSDDEARSSLRLTMGRGTTLEQIERTAAVLSQLVKN